MALTDQQIEKLGQFALVGATKYLDETIFTAAFFAKHGEHGKTTGEKAKALLDPEKYTQTHEHILLVLDAIFLSTKRPTFTKYVYDAIMEGEDGFFTQEDNKLKIEGSWSVKPGQFTGVNISILSTVIHNAIKDKTGKDESLLCRSRRSSCLKLKYYDLVDDNPKFFESAGYNKVPQGNGTPPSCTIS